MAILVVGAGAAGGYIGERLIAGGREVIFLVHSQTLQPLASRGLRLRHGTQDWSTAINAVTADELDNTL